MTTFASNIDVFGVRLAIRSNESAVLARLPPHLPLGWKPLATDDVERIYHLEADRSDYVLRQGERVLERTDDLGYALRMLEYDMELHIAEHARDFVFVHAGVVGWQGKALIIPGNSYSGKSTLVASLCEAGATYYSDEYALLDSAGRVHAYPRPIQLRQPIIPVGEWSRADNSPKRRPLPIGLVVLTHYQPQAIWQPSRVSHGQAILEMLQHALSARSQTKRTLAVLHQALRLAQVLQGERGEARDVRQELLRNLAS